MNTADTATTDHDHEDEDVRCECGNTLVGLPGDQYCDEPRCPNGRYE